MEALPQSPLDQDLALESILALGQTCHFDGNHSKHVTKLALKLFDETKQLHNFTQQERFWLQCAGLLHDIGWSEGWKGHHKTSFRIILETPLLPFSQRERLLIGSIGRYHRQALPSLKHAHYASLDREDQERVDILAAILRLADGLDRSHKGVVRDLSCKISKKKITIRLATDIETIEEKVSAMQKSDLMHKVFRRKIIMKWVDSL